MYSHDEDITLLRGKILESVEENGDEMLFVTTDGDAFCAYHMQDCCETVRVYDVIGDLNVLIGVPIVAVSEEISSEWENDVPIPKYLDSFTWTKHKFTTKLGTVVVRWLGESNGYYSERVHFGRTHKPIV